jgi:hypothetical protein
MQKLHVNSTTEISKIILNDVFFLFANSVIDDVISTIHCHNNGLLGIHKYVTQLLTQFRPHDQVHQSHWT